MIARWSWVAFGAVVGVVAAAAAQQPAAAAAPAPEVFLSLRGVVGDTIEVGEPLFVAVRIEAPFEASVAIELAPATGTWADAVEVVLVRAGTELPLRAAAVGKPASAAAKLDAEQAASGEWYFASGTTRQLDAGDYAVQARLTMRDASGWNGTVASEPRSLRVAAPTAMPERVLQRTIALASEALVVGDLRAAVRLADTQLADRPDDLRLLSLRARISARAGDLQAARTCVARALTTAEAEALTHPPIGLVALRDQIDAALMAQDRETAAPPEWTKLPPRVLEPRRPRPIADPHAAPGAAPLATDPRPAAPATPTTSTTPAAAAPPPGVVVPAATLTDANVVADAAGQWASDANASTQYSAPNYAAAKLTGPPDVPGPGDHVNAWCHGSVTGEQWLELGFATPVHATEVRARQTSAPGAVVRVEAIDPGGGVHVWWQGKDPYQPPATPAIAWFAVRVPRTDYLVAKLRITLDLAAVTGWKEIDAVQLVGAAK